MDGNKIKTSVKNKFKNSSARSKHTSSSWWTWLGKWSIMCHCIPIKGKIPPKAKIKLDQDVNLIIIVSPDYIFFVGSWEKMFETWKTKHSLWLYYDISHIL